MMAGVIASDDSAVLSENRMVGSSTSKRGVPSNSSAALTNRPLSADIIEAEGKQ